MNVLESDPARVIERRIEQVYRLPPMPELGRRILALQSNPNASAQQLGQIVELDPSLAAQVIRYASSSYYGYPGRITNIQDAIARVLGYEMVLNLALGMATGRSFKIPEAGPLGLSSFWERAICMAVLTQKLAPLVPASLRPAAGEAYLCGLLHDFGVLLLGHLFPPEFQLLNRMSALHPDQPLSDIERNVLGMGEAREMLALGHARIGAWLMQTWKMPESIQITLLEHHNPGYSGDHQVLVHLVQLAEGLLRQRVDARETVVIPETSIGVCQIASEDALDVLEQVNESAEELLRLSSLLVAVS